MDKQTLIVALIASLPGFFLGVASLWIAIKKNPHEIQLTDAETDNVRAETNGIHAQIADRWAEHVNEFMETVRKLEDLRERDAKEIAGLRIDIAQGRRENERYRSENSDLRDWAERLVHQLIEHAPTVPPARFIRKSLDLDIE